MTKNGTYMLEMRDKLVADMARAREELERLKSKGDFAEEEDVRNAEVAYAKTLDAWRVFGGCKHDFELMCDTFGFTEESFLEFVADN